MAASRDHQRHIASIADSTLSLFTEIAASAKIKLSHKHPPSPDTLASVNTLNAYKAIRLLGYISSELRRDLQILSLEPAVARIVALDGAGKKVTYFICRAAPPDVSSGEAKLASYRSPVGRLASLPVGSDFELRKPSGTENLKVLERALLRPSLVDQDWDSVDSTLESHEYDPLTVVSFRALLRLTLTADQDSTLLDSLLVEERNSKNILDGIQRSIITKMTLRDQPVLDKYQDEIFRLPLDSRLVILGPPGTGKTTTLIRRLGQKLDSRFLEDNERDMVERAGRGDAPPHEQSWIMFTPTELLKQYVKEAFPREGIAASDYRIRTWSDYRRELARSRFGVLRTAVGGGSFVMKDTLNSLQDSTIDHQIEWFEGFRAWQISTFWSELDAAARSLRGSTETSVAALGTKLSAILERVTARSSAVAFISLAAVKDDVQKLMSSKKDETDSRIREALNRQVNRDSCFLDDLAKLIDSLSDLADEPDDQESEDEEDPRHPRAGRQAALEAYMRAVRAQARAEATKRSLGRTSRSGRIAEWLGERSLAKEERLTVGESLQIQAAARRFLYPLRRYIEGIPTRYRRFRRVRQREGRWYRPDGYIQTDITPLEVDIILLGILRAACELMRGCGILQDIEDQYYTPLRKIRDLYKNQVVVDEVTDFSPTQLACMGTLSNPRIRSFFACGDFNQRITEWGARSADELMWVFPDIDIKSILVTYRHSRQLNELAKQVIHLSGSGDSHAKLPDNVDSDGVQPILARGVCDRKEIVEWLAERIIEIEQLTRTLPSVAVLVNSEDDVRPTASALNEALLMQNIHAVACSEGKVVGQENDIRVFDVQHIKGLEFEAVFFVGIDQLAEQNPRRFDKYLYVGATRAATYLGLTCAGERLPHKIAALESSFVDSWGTRG